MKTLILLTILFLVKVHGALERVDPLVLIGQGLVKGIKASDGHSKFLGIPYAKVDSDDPFGAAREAPTFEEEIFNAYDNSRKCPQPRFGNFEGSASLDNASIDCLQLSIHVPNKAGTSNPLPVLVWIHGGGFEVGSNDYEAPNLVEKGVIVVTVNYRLGAYGFMCLDDPAVPGNQGLKDVYEALRWVRKNIAEFGGDPDKVTLAGQSAGSAIVLLQLYSNKEKLFDKVIAESGTPLSPGMFGKRGPDVAVKLASYLGLNTTDNKRALAFLAQTHHSLVTGATQDLNIDFKPCAEKSFSGVDSFIDREPYALSNENKIRNTPILIGHSDLEYLGDATMMHDDDFLNKDFFYATLNEKFDLENDQLEKAAEILRHYYIGDKPVSEDVKLEAGYFMSDFEFNHPIQDTLTSLYRDNANPIYGYVFSYVGDSGAEGASHGAELSYLFDMTFTGAGRKELSEDDLLMVDRITTLWSNFIKYGNPIPEISDLLPVQWTPVSETTRPYLNISSELRMESRFRKESNAFWDIFQFVYGKYTKLAGTTETSDLIPINWTPVTDSTRSYLNIGSELRMEDGFLKERKAFWDQFQSVYGTRALSNLARHRQCDY